MENMKISGYQQGDEYRILGLFGKAFRKPLDILFWRWRYLDNPYGQGIIRLMFDEEELVGHYAVIPIPLMVDGEIIRAALSMTTMTHPDYGKQGIFTTLAPEVYSECKRNGIKMVIGFANINSYHGLTNRLGWTGFGQVTYREIKSLENISEKNHMGYSCKEIKDLGSEIDDLWERQRSEYSVIIPRDSKYLCWRYVNNPTEEYTIMGARDSYNKLQGYIVLKKYLSQKGTIGHIVDLLGSNNEATIESLLNAAIKYFRDNRVKTVTIWSYLSRPIRCTLEQLGFIEKKWVGFDLNEWPTYFGIKSLEPEGKWLTSVGNKDNWYITMGDSDVF